MKKINSLLYKIIALTLTAISVPIIIISFFTFPVELIIFEPVNYYSVMNEQVYQEEFPQLVSDIISAQLFISDGAKGKEGRKYQEKLSIALSNYLPSDWLEEIAVKVIDNTIEYFNFKTSFYSIEVNIQDLKSAIFTNSTSIAEEFVLSLENCTKEEGGIFSGNETIILNSFEICKPSGNNIQVVSESMDEFIQNKTNQLPSKLNVFGVIPVQMVPGKQFFYYYSITRWLFRLLPFLSLIILIFIAQLLKNNKKIMRKWVGLILTILPAVLILCLIIILIGFDQIIGLFFKQNLANLIPGFGRILIWIVQSVGKKIILWVSGIAAIVLVFGLIMILFARFTKNDTGLSSSTQNKIEATPNKVIVPETLEEIEEKEAQEESGKLE
jgi:hypothetical protein